MARTRSPSYPGIDLKEAIEKATTIYKNEGTGAALVDTIAGHWGYKPRTGSVNTAMSALRKFGLVEYEGSGDSRKAKLTDIALRIIRDDREVSPERDAMIRRIALKPKIHNELWEKVQTGASDDTLISFLKLDLGFSDRAAPELVEEFRQTADYAKLWDDPELGSDRGTDSEVDKTATGDFDDGLLFDGAPVRDSQQEATDKRSRIYKLPLTSRMEAVLQVPPEMTESHWDQMMAVLQAMKPGILAETDEE